MKFPLSAMCKPNNCCNFKSLFCCCPDEDDCSKPKKFNQPKIKMPKIECGNSGNKDDNNNKNKYHNLHGHHFRNRTQELQDLHQFEHTYKLTKALKKVKNVKNLKNALKAKNTNSTNVAKPTKATIKKTNNDKSKNTAGSFLELFSLTETDVTKKCEPRYCSENKCTPECECIVNPFSGYCKCLNDPSDCSSKI